MEGLMTLWSETGIANFEFGQICMILVGCTLLFFWLFVKALSHYCFCRLVFGAILANIPNAGFTEEGGLLYYVYYVGIESGIFPLLIFMGVGAMTDFWCLDCEP
ncbi:sodium ion-translocating decarboxylase subunit beta [Vibrio sinaloensis]|nr:sodium ion-translocating decarboxylase subunit beta [Vibrio sinaloensis]